MEIIRTINLFQFILKQFVVQDNSTRVIKDDYIFDVSDDLKETVFRKTFLE